MQNIELLEQNAVDAAVNAQWKEAIDLNTIILKQDGENIDACLRLGFAYLQSNKLTDAERVYKKALRIQPKNIIAMEHLEKIEVLTSKKKSKTMTTAKYDPELFLEVPGRTKTIHLVNLGQKEDLAGRNTGEEVMLKEKKRRLEARSLDGEYIGTLPDDISKRLIYFMQEGSEYKTYIKEIDFTDVIVFIKEEIKGKKVRQYPSFPSNAHSMLNDINQLEEELERPHVATPAGADGEEDDDVDDPLTPDMHIEDEDEAEDTAEEEEEEESWDIEEDKELHSFVHVEEEEEE